MYGGRQITMADVVGEKQNSKRKPQSTGGKAKVETRKKGDVDLQEVLIERQALHAFRLQFVHPTKFTRMMLEAKMPGDMERILELLRVNTA